MNRAALILVAFFLSLPAFAAPGGGDEETSHEGAPPAQTSSTAQQLRLQKEAAIGDLSGGKFIPPGILSILADPRIDPNVAYMLWQLSRKPISDWTIGELGFVAQIAPTILEAGVPMARVQMLYTYWGLDPSDVFHPSLALNWQSQSTAYSQKDFQSVGAISSAECQGDPGQLTVGTYESCREAVQ